MKLIEITALQRHDSYTELSYLMRFTLPAILGTSTAPVQGIAAIVASQPDGFSLEVIKGVSPAPDTTNIIFTQTISIPLNTTAATIQSQLVTKYNLLKTKLTNLALTPYEAVAALSWDGTSWS